MGSKTREARIVASVPCPECGARIGERCRYRTEAEHQAGAGRLLVHHDRRLDWQRHKRATSR